MESVNTGTGLDEESADRTSADSATASADWRDHPSALESLFSAVEERGHFDDQRPSPAVRRRRARRRLLVALVVLAVLAGSAGGGWAFVQHRQKQPALKALRAANAHFEPAAAALRSAADLPDLRDAANAASVAADEVLDAGEPLAQPTTQLERRVRAVLAGEAAMLRAAATTASLDLQDLAKWPAMQTRIAESEKSLDAAVERLGDVDADAARSVRTGHELAAYSAEVVGDFAATTVVTQLAAHLDDLLEARTTADLRTVAARTGRTGKSVTLALEGVDPESAQGTQVSAVGDTVQALSRLKGLDGDHLRRWKPIRKDLQSAATDLEDVDTTEAVASVDRLVSDAGKKLRRWRLATAKAEARQEKATERLTAYVDETRPALKSYDALARTTSEFARQVLRGEKGGIDYPNAVTFLTGSTRELASMQEALTGTKAVPALREEHRALVRAVAGAGKAVDRGSAGLDKPRGCVIRAPKVRGPVDPEAPAPDPVCLYGGSRGWAAFQKGWQTSAQAVTSARSAWDKAVTEQRTRIEERKLPEKPVV